MIAILRKELNLFFASPIGYLVIAVFLVVNGLFLWVFNGEFNILNAGFADLNNFFSVTPWFFVFLIPAITMRTFSDEIRSGTMEILKTKPISSWSILIGKYLGSLLLILLALLPTLTYVFTIGQLAAEPEKIDYGTILGSYLGLMFLASAVTAIGMMSSVLSNNQIVAFLAGVFLSFLMFYGFEALADLNLMSDFGMENLGMREHFNSLGRGIVDTRDIVYFLSLTLFFLYLTKMIFDKK